MEEADDLFLNAALDWLDQSSSLNNSKNCAKNSSVIKDINVPFLEKVEPDEPQSKENEKSEIHTGLTDSSDDEDNKYFEETKYNQYGKDLKNFMKNKVGQKTDFACSSWKSKEIKTEIKPETYVDPLFGIRIINPVVSSTMIKTKMSGRTAISFFKVKNHAKNGDLKQDWVIAGVLVAQSPPKISQKGSKYLIWTISDLKEGLKTVSVFLFGRSYDDLWKTSVGTVLGILNPKPLDQSKSSKDEATLSIMNPDQVMIWGKSKDYGICKGIKKNGEKCNSFVNKYQCEFCVYHVQSEYRKYTGRAELQSTSGGIDKIRNRVLGKNEVFYGGKSYTALPKVGNSKKLKAKDVQTLGKLGIEQVPVLPVETSLPITRSTNLLKMINSPKSNLEENDKKRLNLLNSNSTRKEKIKPALTNPETDIDLDLSKPVRQAHLKTHFTSLVSIKQDGNRKENKKTVVSKRLSNAKKKALAFVQKNGEISKLNPTGVKKDELIARGLKRPLETETDDDSGSKISERFLELMKQGSKHLELIEAHDMKEQEAYFEKMGKKEQLEEKMMSIYKIECKAVRCQKCKYTWFSASDKCKSEGHPIKVIDACKRFFKCIKCSNRTVSLEILPIISCKKCGASSWTRTTMMKDKIISKNHELSIRGGEQTFMNSCIANANIDLMVPE